MTRALRILFLGLGVASVAQAQLISPKTVPVAMGDQFLIFPSEYFGMGGVAIALDDPLHDPFVNPAKGSAVTGWRMFGTPTFYNISGNDGSARTLPLGVLAASDTWFGGLTLAIQQLQPGNRFFGGGPIPLRPELANTIMAPFPEPGLSERSANNMYAFAMGGRKLADGRTSVGASITWAGLNAVDGVDLMYALANTIEQYGHMLDLRFGMTRDLGGDRSLELLALHNRFNMTHDVSYVDFVFDPAPCTDPGGNFIPCPFEWRTRMEHNVDRTNTWAEADRLLQSVSGQPIYRGMKTVANDFEFSNALIRMGVGREEERYGLQLGLNLRSISYRLRQEDFIQETSRVQRESWMEWTPAWSASLKFPEFQIRYAGRVQTGTGRPGVAWTGARGDAMELASTVIIAPSGPLTLQEASVLTHQIALVMPIR